MSSSRVPQHLHRRAWHLLGDLHRLDHVVVPAAPAEAAAEHHLVHFDLVGRQARCRNRRRECAHRRPACRTTPRTCRRDERVAFIGSIGAWFWYGYE
jgi:hypothetical protein